MKILPANALTQTAEYSRGYFHVTVPNHTRTEDILKPGFWSNHVYRLKPGYLVDLVTEDFELDIQFRVIRVDPGMVVMRPRVAYESEARRAEQHAAEEAAEPAAPLPPDPQTPDGYKVGHSKGLGHYVMLKANGQNIATKLPSKSAAIRFAVQHEKIANAPMGGVAGQGAPAEGAGAGA